MIKLNKSYTCLKNKCIYRTMYYIKVKLPSGKWVKHIAYMNTKGERFSRSIESFKQHFELFTDR